MRIYRWLEISLIRINLYIGIDTGIETQKKATLPPREKVAIDPSKLLEVYSYLQGGDGELPSL